MAYNLRIAYLNVVSLSAHFADIKNLIRANDLQIICMTETCLKPIIPSSFVEIGGYNLVRRDRIDRARGGIAIYARSDIKIREYSLSTCDGGALENLIVTLDLKKVTIVLGIVYRSHRVCTVAESIA